MNKQSLKVELEKRNIPLSEDTLNQLEKYMHHILSWNEKFNLTAIKDEDAFYEKMILDSAIGMQKLDLTNKKVIDIGTGAGFPGVILYLLNPKMDITLLDSTNKKINLLNEYAKENGLSYKGVCARAEDYARNHREEYNYAFARAVAPLNILLELIVPLLKVNGTFIAMKGPNGEEEIAEAQKAFKKLNCHVEKIINDSLSESNEKRTLIYIKKDSVTINKYPRDYQTIKKLPL